MNVYVLAFRLEMHPLCFMKLYALLLSAFLPFLLVFPLPVLAAPLVAMCLAFVHQFWLAMQLRQLDLGLEVSLAYTMLWCDVVAFLLVLLIPFLWLSVLLAPVPVAQWLLPTLPVCCTLLSCFWCLPWFWPYPVYRLAFVYHAHTSPAREERF